jgi:hypothetical protein
MALLLLVQSTHPQELLSYVSNGVLNIYLLRPSEHLNRALIDKYPNVFLTFVEPSQWITFTLSN